MEITITCAEDGLSAQLLGRMRREGTLISIFTGKLKRVGNLPESDLDPAKPEPGAKTQKLTPQEVAKVLNMWVGEWTSVDKETNELVEKFTIRLRKQGKSNEGEGTSFENGKVKEKHTFEMIYNPDLDVFIQIIKPTNKPPVTRHLRWDLRKDTGIAEYVDPKLPPGVVPIATWKKTGPNTMDFKFVVHENGKLVFTKETVITRKRPADEPAKPEPKANDKKPGTVLWEFETGGAVYSSPAIGIDGTVYVGSWDKKVYALDGKSGAKKWKFQTGDRVCSSPSIGSDGTVYIGSNDKKIYAIKTASKGLAKSPWPMRSQNPQHTGRAVLIDLEPNKP